MCQTKTVQTVDNYDTLGSLAHASYAMDATNVVTSTDTVGIGYHRWEQLVHLKVIITMEDDHHALDTPEIDVMTEEATADPMLGCTQETEVQVAQDSPAQTDTPAGTGTQDKGTRWTTTELKTYQPRQQSSSNRPPTPYTRHNSRSRSSSSSNEKPHRCSVTIQDNPEDHEDQDYNNSDDYFDEDLN